MRSARRSAAVNSWPEFARGRGISNSNVGCKINRRAARCPACTRVAASFASCERGGERCAAGSSQHMLLVTAIDWYAGIRKMAAKRPATAW